MKLHYRGLSYKSHPENIETAETEIKVKFRGQIYQCPRPLVGDCSRPNVNLKYRGVDYTVKPTPAIKPETSENQIIS